MPRKQRFKPSRKQPPAPVPGKQSQPPDKHEEMHRDTAGSDLDVERDMQHSPERRDIERDQ